jgi:hypothetical protein
MPQVGTIGDAEVKASESDGEVEATIGTGFLMGAWEGGELLIDPALYEITKLSDAGLGKAETSRDFGLEAAFADQLVVELEVSAGRLSGRATARHGSTCSLGAISVLKQLYYFVHYMSILLSSHCG